MSFKKIKIKFAKLQLTSLCKTKSKKEFVTNCYEGNIGVRGHFPEK